MKASRHLLGFAIISAVVLSGAAGWSASIKTGLAEMNMVSAPANVGSLATPTPVALSSKTRDAVVLKRVGELAAANQPEKALRLLNKNEKSLSRQMSADLISMTRGRLFFQMNMLDQAYLAYDKVPKSSDFWLEAMEEKAHVMGRKSEYAKTLALLKTAMAEPFAPIIGPEPYFVAALTHLKICDYSSVFKVTGAFKNQFRDRITKLTELSKIGDSEAVRELFAKLRAQPLTYESVGVLAKALPRHLQRDAELVRHSERRPEARRDQIMRERIRVLAQRDLKEIEAVANKLQIIEAEVIQRIHLAEKSKSNRETQGKISKNGEVLVFPESDEVWIDELDHYSAQVEKCPKNKAGAKL